MEGLTSTEAISRLQKYGPNTITEKRPNYFWSFCKKFSSPIAWMLEGIILIEIILHKPMEAVIIASLLLFNVALSFFNEERAQKALLLLKKRLSVMARVLRDREWQQIPANELVPGDIIRIRMGDIIPADVKLLDGHLSVDQSVLTGESLPIEATLQDTCYSGSIVKKGESIAQVFATGIHSFYGKTAEIVRLAKIPSHLETTIFQIIRYLVSFDVFLIFSLLLYSFYFHLPFQELLPFSLLLLVAAVPIALPATFTLATALGSLELAKSGVLVTRLSAIEDAAGMTVLCVDKTGTITKNVLEVSDVYPYEAYSKDDILSFAAMASEESTQDPIDLAILKALKSPIASLKKLTFIPFDPEKKYSEAIVSMSNTQKSVSIRFGAPSALIQKPVPELETFGKDGSRILCVSVDGQLAGLIKIQDPLRDESPLVIQEIKNLGIRMIMLTGDFITTARAIAEKAGLGSRVIPRDQIDQISQADAIAGVFPEDKFHIIQNLQKNHSICGMTGDGVNDAPALKAAEVGIAVANATDVAKASASLVLTNEGLQNILEAIKTSRRIYQRMSTYILNKIIKTLEISILLVLGIMLKGTFIISEILLVLLFFANDFVTMSIATDNVSYSQKPNVWNIRTIVAAACFFAAMILGFSFSVLYLGAHYLNIPQLQTLIFLTLVFNSQATVYLVREKTHHFWHTLPSPWMLLSSLFDILIVSFLAIRGILMEPLSPSIIFGLLGSILIYFLILDWIKVKFFQLGSIPTNPISSDTSEMK